MGEDQLALLERQWELISVGEVMSQNSIDRPIIGMAAGSENGKILRVLVLRWFWGMWLKKIAEQIKTTLGNLLCLKMERGSLRIHVEFPIYFLFTTFGRCVTCQAWCQGYWLGRELLWVLYLLNKRAKCCLGVMLSTTVTCCEAQWCDWENNRIISWNGLGSLPIQTIPWFKTNTIKQV